MLYLGLSGSTGTGMLARWRQGVTDTHKSKRGGCAPRAVFPHCPHCLFLFQFPCYSFMPSLHIHLLQLMVKEFVVKEVGYEMI